MASMKVIFDRSDRKYSPGEKINLEIRVYINSETTVRKIYAKFHGFGHVDFQTFGSYFSHETYFKTYKTLIGSEEGPDTRLIAGSHLLYASYLLPQHLPENYESATGHIRYEAKIHLVNAYNFDIKEKIPFFIKPRFDLNRFQQLKDPLRFEAKKRFGSFCWKSEPLYIYNILPRRAFTPGECVQYTLELKNSSNVSIKSATVKLIEKITHRAQTEQIAREKCRTLWFHTFTNSNDQLVAPMQNKVFSTDLYFNPDWCFHFLDGCKIIYVEYNIISEANTNIRYANLINTSQIYMGTIPFANNSMSSQPRISIQSPGTSQSLIPLRYPIPVRQVERIHGEQPLPPYEEQN